MQDPLEPNTINAKVMQRIVGGKYDFPKDVRVSPECLDLIARIFTPDPAKRIKTEEIKRHSWLSGAAHRLSEFCTVMPWL